MPPNQPRELEEIPGIGAQRAEALRESGFESIAALRKADKEELMQVEMIDDVLAEDIKSTVAPGSEREEYRLRVPIDAATIEEDCGTASQDLHVVARTADDSLRRAPVELEADEGIAELVFKEQPGALGVYVGPETVEPAELVQTQTLTANVPERFWMEESEVTLDPIRIPQYYWDWWREWCRTFTIRGQLTCPDGTPVPGAEVCAKDVDSWFYWSSIQEVGCDTTDEYGTFEIEFRWCCGFRPWWWWQERPWDPNDILIDRIGDVVREVPELSLAEGGHQPGLGVFDTYLDDAAVTADDRLAEIDPNDLERIRTDLADRLPAAPDLRRLGVWPWAPWQPWSDCSPDLIFEATQDGVTILDETIDDTRWDVSTSEEVRLEANDEAICRDDCTEPPCPCGECVLVTDVCHVAKSNIGGNFGAAATPEGYANPGPGFSGPPHKEDRPFAGRVSLWRQGGCIENIDFFEIEYHDGSSWAPVPSAGLSDFGIRYLYNPAPGSYSRERATIGVRNIGGRRLIPTREYLEEDLAPMWATEYTRRRARGETGLKATNAWWHGRQMNRLAVIDSTAFDDGTYSFRLVGYEAFGSGDDVEVERRGVVTRCPEEEETPVEVTLTFDNRTRVPVASHPHPTAILTPGSGTGTVHKPYVEPDTSISSVVIDPADPDKDPFEVPTDEEAECPSVPELEGTLRITFIARDPVGPDNPVGHLGDYILRVTFGRSKRRTLLDKPSASVTALSGGVTGHAAGQARGDYRQALADGATRPGWEGGTYELEIDLADAFPKPCCYELELRARKRTIVNCGGDHDHWNLSQYSIGYGV